MKLCIDCKWCLLDTKRRLGTKIQHRKCYHPSIFDDAPVSPITGVREVSHTDRLCDLIRMDSCHKCGIEGNLWEAK